MGCSLSLAPLARFVAGRAGARPDHPINGPQTPQNDCDLPEDLRPPVWQTAYCRGQREKSQCWKCDGASSTTLLGGAVFWPLASALRTYGLRGSPLERRVLSPRLAGWRPSKT